MSARPPVALPPPIGSPEADTRWTGLATRTLVCGRPAPVSEAISNPQTGVAPIPPHGKGGRSVSAHLPNGVIGDP